MGWKNVRDHYRIKHHVHITDEGLCIGSPYIHNLIVINPDGKIKSRDSSNNADLRRYQAEFNADPELLRRLIETPDVFTASIPVYTYDCGDIIEKQCEELGWPNVTHDGKLMYENTYFPTREKAAAKAKRSACAAIEAFRNSIARCEEGLVRDRERLEKFEAGKLKLDTDFPDVTQ